MQILKFVAFFSFVVIIFNFTLFSRAQMSQGEIMSVPTFSTFSSPNFNSANNSEPNRNLPSRQDNPNSKTSANSNTSTNPNNSANLSTSANLSFSSVYSSSLQTVIENQVSTQTTTGEIQSILGNNLVVLSNNQTAAFTITDNIKITRNSVGAKSSDLKPRDQVTITKSGQNIISIEAMASGEVSDLAKIAIPLFILLILILGLAFYFWKKSQEGSIKTTPTNFN